MTQIFDEATKLGREILDSSMKSATGLQKGVQAIANKATGYSKTVLETSAATFEKLFAVKSLEGAIEIQTDFAKKAYEGFIAEATKFSELYADLAKETYQPFETISAKVR